MRTVLRDVAIVLQIVLATPAGAAAPERPSVLLLLIDALRADHLHCYGYERPTSPRIDSLAGESVLFVNAYSQSPWTKPSIPTIFTSLYPLQHRVYEGEAHGPAAAFESDTLSEELLTLAEAFRAAGFRTAGFVNNAHLPASHGFAQGFEVYEQANLSAVEINRKFLAFAATDAGRPFFAYLHYLDVHWPFRPSPAFARRFGDGRASAVFDQEDWQGLRDRINDGTVQIKPSDRERLVALHDAAVAELDEQIGALLDELQRRDLLDRMVVLLTADHGEELLDHGKVGHGGTLFDEVLRIPMMLRLPRRERAARVETPARLLDVYPTLLRAAGVDPPMAIEGRNLLDTAKEPPELAAEMRHKRTYAVALRRGRWKYIRSYSAAAVATLASDKPGTFGLQPGMRVKVKGWFSSDGSLVADKVTVKDSSDDDVEVSGPVAELDDTSREFTVHVYRVMPARKLRVPDPGSVLQTLQNGEWIKVEGDVVPPTTLLADKIERLPPGDRELEVEGIVTKLERLSAEAARARVGDVSVLLTKDTRVKGVAPPADQPVRTPAPASDDPFTPERLLAGQGLKVHEQLFDLEKDPSERHDLAGDEAQRLGELRRGLEGWLRRMSLKSRPGARRVPLDQETVERLRGLGYVE